MLEIRFRLATPADAALPWGTPDAVVSASVNAAGSVRFDPAPGAENAARALASRGGLCSARVPFRLARSAFGAGARMRAVLGASGAAHRILAPGSADPTAFLVSLVAATRAFPAATLDVERVAPAPGELGAEDAHAVLAAASLLGYYEVPPRATLADVAVATGLPASAVLDRLARFERETLAAREAR